MILWDSRVSWYIYPLNGRIKNWYQNSDFGRGEIGVLVEKIMVWMFVKLVLALMLFYRVWIYDCVFRFDDEPMKGFKKADYSLYRKVSNS